MRRTRDGIALATTLYFLALLGLLVVGTLYTARGAGRGGELSIDDAELTAATEQMLASIVAEWSPEDRAIQPIASTFSVPSLRTTRVERAGSITRLDPRLFWVVADVRRTAGSARRRTAIVVRLAREGPAVPAAIVARGDVQLGAGARVLAPAQPLRDCSIDDSTGVAVETATAAVVRVEDAFTTMPSWRATDGAAAAEPYQPLGTRSRDQLQTTLELSPDTALTIAPAAAGDCGATRAPDDWGDPYALDGPCARLAPIVHARGDLTLRGGRGQGILLVDGRLRVTGALRFRGLIVSQGGVDIMADDVDISGAIFSADTHRSIGGAAASSVVIRGRATVRASRCDVARAFAAHSSVRRVRERAWIELW